MATKKQTPETTKVRVLVAGNFGQPDDVVEIAADQLETVLASGQVDPAPEAVAHAESLK